MNVSILLTCHNRRQKTEACLKSLKKALQIYNGQHNDSLKIEIFLTDDGCTDGTADAARAVFPNENELHILKGDGNLYWAGGMRYCWQEALKRHPEWDYYLLLNDDVELMDNLFEELLATIKCVNKTGLYSGNTCWRDNPTKRSYGGRVWLSRFWGTTKALEPSGEPQECDLVNANILLVPKEIVDKIGIFYDRYRHGHADYDYGIMAKKAGFHINVTANFCGICNNDHKDKGVNAAKVVRMTLRERKEYFRHPLHSTKDYLTFIRRSTPIRLPMVCLGSLINLYLPKLYYKIKKIKY